MLIRHLFTPGLAINSYLVYDEVSKKGGVIDPTRQVEAILARALQEGVEITDIFETHVHADFMSGAPELKEALEGKLVIHCSGMGGREWTPSYADHAVKDRDQIKIGALRLEAWHTPGHTPEHVMWLVYDEARSATIPAAAFTGDLLFVGSIGRPDLLGEKAEEELAKQLYNTLFKEIHSLPDFVEIFPGHGSGSLCGKGIGSRPSSTLGYEKRCNPGLIPQPYPVWYNVMQEGMLPAPQYFSRMKHENLRLSNTCSHPGMILRLDKERLKQVEGKALPIDIRPAEAFVAGSFKGALHIPWMPNFPFWAGAMLPCDQELFLVVSKNTLVQNAVQALRLVGLDNVIGYVDTSLLSGDEKRQLFVSGSIIDAALLQQELASFYVLDVRTEKEWNEGHIPGAHHLELTNLPTMMHNIPSDKPVATICHSGNRSSIAASMLKKYRGINASTVAGGMQAWNNLKKSSGYCGY